LSQAGQCTVTTVETKCLQGQQLWHCDS